MLVRSDRQVIDANPIDDLAATDFDKRVIGGLPVFPDLPRPAFVLIDRPHPLMVLDGVVWAAALTYEGADVAMWGRKPNMLS